MIPYDSFCSHLLSAHGVNCAIEIRSINDDINFMIQCIRAIFELLGAVELGPKCFRSSTLILFRPKSIMYVVIFHAPDWPRQHNGEVLSIFVNPYNSVRAYTHDVTGASPFRCTIWVVRFLILMISSPTHNMFVSVTVTVWSGLVHPVSFYLQPVEYGL